VETSGQSWQSLAMRVVAVVVVVAAGVGTGAASIVRPAAASHRVASAFLHHATGVTWSPDGRQIGFSYVPFSEAVCGCGTHVRSWIVRRSRRTGGAIRTVLAKKSLAVGSVSWAAGGRILFTDGPFLYRVGVNGGKPKRVVAPDCQSYYGCQMSASTLSPNRKVAAVETCDCGDPHLGGFLELVRLYPGGVSAQFTPGPIDAAAFRGFSPDSRQMIFGAASGLMALPLDGGDPVPLAQSGIPGASLVPNDAQQVQWSPDGTWVAYVEDNKLAVAPTTSASTPRVLATCSFFYGLCFRFSWSHDSKLLAYEYYASETAHGFRLMTVRPDGTHLTNPLLHHRLTYEGDAQWSPRASRLVFLASRPRLQVVHVWAIRANGPNLTRIG
jgi:hypothetical protein